jgi:hypothetical protein
MLSALRHQARQHLLRFMTMQLALDVLKTTAKVNAYSKAWLILDALLNDSGLIGNVAAF